MNDTIKTVLVRLDQSGISYKLVEHEPVYTIEDMLRLKLDEHGEIPKNLFLRNGNGKQHYLVIVREDKTVNLKALRETIGSTALSFASEERLMEHLGLLKGSVTPFGVLNNSACDVAVFVDRDLAGQASLGFHPNQNTATVFLPFAAVERIVKEHGNPVDYINIPVSE